MNRSKGMPQWLRRAPLRYRVRWHVKRVTNWLVAAIALTAIRGLEALGPRRAAAMCSWLARKFGRFFGPNRTALHNLRAAFPEKSEEEIQAILTETWDNLGRTAGEFPHLHKIYDFTGDGGESNIEIVGEENFLKLAEDGKGAIIFAAHLANWELPAVAAARHDLPVTVLYQTPSNHRMADYIANVRGGTMGTMLPTSATAVFGVASALENGEHIGLLVDQRYYRGFIGTMFGRPCKINTVVAKLARTYDVPVHGTRVVRLPEGRFRIELTDEIELPRGGDGRIDIPAASQAISDIIEGWVRENPGQWLWQHKRWAHVNLPHWGARQRREAVARGEYTPPKRRAGAKRKRGNRQGKLKAQAAIRRST